MYFMKFWRLKTNNSSVKISMEILCLPVLNFHVLNSIFAKKYIKHFQLITQKITDGTHSCSYIIMFNENY